jgi:hypothetical protein
VSVYTYFKDSRPRVRLYLFVGLPGYPFDFLAVSSSVFGCAYVYECANPDPAFTLHGSGSSFRIRIQFPDPDPTFKNNAD